MEPFKRIHVAAGRKETKLSNEKLLEVIKTIGKERLLQADIEMTSLDENGNVIKRFLTTPPDYKGRYMNQLQKVLIALVGSILHDMYEKGEFDEEPGAQNILENLN